MPSSTFSSERLPSSPLLASLQSAFLLFLLVVLALELGLAMRGIRPNQEDSESLWLHERARADALGSRALVMIGGSRILLDTDLTEMKRLAPDLEPVQLAIDGVSFLPILRGLAQDPHFHGRLIIDFNDYLIDGSRHHTPDSIAVNWEHDFEEDRTHPWPHFLGMEDRLQDLVRSHLRAYADGSRPWSALTRRLLARYPVAQYLWVLPNRSIDADYQRLQQPQAYLTRVGSTLHVEINYSRNLPWPILMRALAGYIARLPIHANTAYLHNVTRLNDEIRAIQQRGGWVAIIVSPTSGLIRDYLEEQNPRPSFWDQLVSRVQAPTLRVDDIALRAGFLCPDGSHLDRRDKSAYTDLLMQQLDNAGLEAPTPRH